MAGHNFLWVVVHPQRRDHVICLERNYYPEKMDKHVLVFQDGDESAKDPSQAAHSEQASMSIPYLFNLSVI